MTPAKLTIRDMNLRAVMVPLRRPLVTRIVVIERAPLLLIDLLTEEGVTGWMRAAALAEVAGIAMSSHLMPEISCHLMTATPTRHWLEYVDWASPILAAPLQVENGQVRVPDTPGSGIAWNEDAIPGYQVEL